MTSERSETTDWPALWAAMANMDGEEQDDERDRLEQLWKSEYRQAFVVHALKRPGWDRENAEAWADDFAGEAEAACGSACTPEEVARVDVLEVEKESRYV